MYSSDTNTHPQCKAPSALYPVSGCDSELKSKDDKHVCLAIVNNSKVTIVVKQVVQGKNVPYECFQVESGKTFRRQVYIGEDKKGYEWTITSQSGGTVFRHPFTISQPGTIIVHEPVPPQPSLHCDVKNKGVPTSHFMLIIILIIVLSFGGYLLLRYLKVGLRTSFEQCVIITNGVGADQCKNINNEQLNQLKKIVGRGFNAQFIPLYVGGVLVTIVLIAWVFLKSSIGARIVGMPVNNVSCSECTSRRPQGSWHYQVPTKSNTGLKGFLLTLRKWRFYFNGDTGGVCSSKHLQEQCNSLAAQNISQDLEGLSWQSNIANSSSLPAHSTSNSKFQKDYDPSVCACCTGGENDSEVKCLNLLAPSPLSTFCVNKVKK